jgi:hypothetical protein
LQQLLQQVHQHAIKVSTRISALEISSSSPRSNLDLEELQEQRQLRQLSQPRSAKAITIEFAKYGPLSQ